MAKCFKCCFLHVCLLLSVLCLPLSASSPDGHGRDYWVERFMSVSYPLKSIEVNSPYGVRKDPFSSVQAYHNGLDLKARYEMVYAMFSGTVEKTGKDSRSGLFVTLRHGSYTVSYCHLSQVLVEAGAEVLAGDAVAVSGNSGRSTGPHLHITCRRNGKDTDPNTLLIYIREVREEAIMALGGPRHSLTAAPHDETMEKLSSDLFFARYAPTAMEEQRKYGIPASVTLSQMACESGWGRSTLARRGNNFFGIKCSREWLESGKPYSLHSDDRQDEKFCNYASVQESIHHHSTLLMSKTYARCHRYSETDYHNWLVGLKQSGYATAKDYVQKCERLIKKYKLYLYDRMALEKAKVCG